MFPGINPKQMQKAMQRMGIKQDEIEAKEVIIKLEDKNLVIKNPSVSKINMQGHETFQIMGDVSEESNIKEDDIKVVMEQTGCNEEEAKKALEKYNDIAEAIISLKK